MGVINLFLLIHAIRNKANQKLVITALIAEAVLYLPWFIFFLFAAMRVSNGFWIVIDYNTILNEIITFVFSAIYSNISMKYTIIIAYPIIFFTIYQMFKLKSKEMALCLKILAVVILIALATSYLRPIFIIRYLFPMIGLIIFMIAYAIASIKNKYIFASFLAAILLFSSYNFYFESQKMYNPLNDEVKTYIGSQLEEGDIIISARTRDLMGVASLMFPDNKCYFFNSDEWSIDICATYPNMERLTDLDMFEDYQGRIWVISGDDTNVYNLIDNSNKKMLEEPQYFVRPAFDNENFYVYLFEITKE